MIRRFAAFLALAAQAVTVAALWCGCADMAPSETVEMKAPSSCHETAPAAGLRISSVDKCCCDSANGAEDSNAPATLTNSVSMGPAPLLSVATLDLAATNELPSEAAWPHRRRPVPPRPPLRV